MLFCEIRQLPFRTGPKTVISYFIRLIEERGMLDIKVVNHPYISYPSDNVIEGRCHFLPTKYVHLNPFISSSLGIEGREVHPSQRVNRGWEMKKDRATLRSHDLKGYGVLQWRVHFSYFSIKLRCFVQGKLFKILRELNVN